MANWVEPKSNYVATDQVTPDIFNTLAENEKFLYEIRCPMEVQDSDGNVTKINSLVFVETTTNGVYKAKYKKSDGTLVEIPIEASQSVKLKTSRSIGINGLDAESASFNGTSAVKIKVTGVPAELLYGTAEINITGNAASATNAKILESSWTAHEKSKYLSYGTYLFQVVIDDSSSGGGGHSASFTDIITVNSYAYHGLNADYRYHTDYPTGANHVYSANNHEAPWYRTARLKVTSLSSTQFKIDLYVSSSGGYESTTTDVNGKQIFPGTEASKVSGLAYQIYYKKIM